MIDDFVHYLLQELISMGWTRKETSHLSPNVVEFTKLFNNINFWVQEECLKEKAVQRRAEVLGHFVKIAKELMKLNNLHGVVAVLAALQVGLMLSHRHIFMDLFYLYHGICVSSSIVQLHILLSYDEKAQSNQWL